MKKIAVVAAAGALVFAVGCGESSTAIDGNQVLVSDSDGKVDARQIREACESRGKKVDSWSETALDLGDGQLVIVTCRP